MFEGYLEDLRRLHRDERGAEEGMSKIVIFMLISLPLIALLIVFGKEIKTKAEQVFKSVMGTTV